MENQILREVQLAQSRLEKDPKVDWWFLQKKIDIEVGPTAQFPVMPSNYERLVDQTVPLFFNQEKTLASKMVRAYPEDALLNEGDYSNPVFFALVGRTIELYPSPAVNGWLSVVYIAREPNFVLEGASPILENQWTKEAFTLLMCKAGIALAQALQAGDALSNFVADYNAAYSETFVESFARADINFSQVRD
jgi:hypothetical protein